MDFNYRIPHPKGEIALSVTGAVPEAAFAAIQMGCEIAAMMGGQVAGAPVDMEPEPTAEKAPSQGITVDGNPYPAKAEPVPVAEAPEEPAADETQTDSAGVAFDPELHTGTLKKDGTWRLKKGAAAKVEGDDEEDAGNAEETPTAAPDAIGTSSITESADAAKGSQETLTEATPASNEADLPEITDAELQRYCGRLAAHFGGSDKVFALAGKHVPEGEMPRPTNIKDQAARHAFVKQAEAETGVKWHG